MGSTLGTPVNPAASLLLERFTESYAPRARDASTGEDAPPTPAAPAPRKAALTAVHTTLCDVSEHTTTFPLNLNYASVGPLACYHLVSTLSTPPPPPSPPALITSLSLRGVGLDASLPYCNEFLAALPSLHVLTYLDLSENPLAGGLPTLFTSLSSMSLHALLLSATSTDDEVCKLIAQLEGPGTRSLLSFNVSDNGITDELGLKILGETLDEAPRIRSMVVGGNDFSPDSTEYHKLLLKEKRNVIVGRILDDIISSVYYYHYPTQLSKKRGAGKNVKAKKSASRKSGSSVEVKGKVKGKEKETETLNETEKEKEQEDQNQKGVEIEKEKEVANENEKEKERGSPQMKNKHKGPKRVFRTDRPHWTEVITFLPTSLPDPAVDCSENSATMADPLENVNSAVKDTAVPTLNGEAMSKEQGIDTEKEGVVVNQKAEEKVEKDKKNEKEKVKDKKVKGDKEKVKKISVRERRVQEMKAAEDAHNANFLRAVLPTIQPSDRFPVGHCEIQNRRKRMEDALLLKGCFRGSPQEDLFGVFDGHGGDAVARYAAAGLPHLFAEMLARYPSDISKALTLTFQKLDAVVTDWARSVGSTGLVAYFTDDMLFTANVGDSRAVISVGGVAERLSFDHKPNDPEEEARIVALGGRVERGRVKGRLGVSRAFGDRSFKKFVTADPHIHQRVISPEDRFLILACDGIFDVFDDQEIVDTIEREISKVGRIDPQYLCRMIMKRSMERGSDDNMSIIIIPMGGGLHQIPVKKRILKKRKKNSPNIIRREK